MRGHQHTFEPAPGEGEDQRLAEAAMLVEQAERCRRLAAATHDREAAGILRAMAADYEQSAQALGC